MFHKTAITDAMRIQRLRRLAIAGALTLAIMIGLPAYRLAMTPQLNHASVIDAILNHSAVPSPDKHSKKRAK